MLTLSVGFRRWLVFGVWCLVFSGGLRRVLKPFEKFLCLLNGSLVLRNIFLLPVY
jgi:hypothetical protein